METTEKQASNQNTATKECEKHAQMCNNRYLNDSDQIKIRAYGKKKKCIDSQASVNCDHIDKFYCHFENGD